MVKGDCRDKQSKHPAPLPIDKKTHSRYNAERATYYTNPNCQYPICAEFSKDECRGEAQEG